MNESHQLTGLKLSICFEILDKVSDDSIEKRAIIQVYLTEALSSCVSIGDISRVVPSALLRGHPLEGIIEKSFTTITDEEVMRIKDKHSEAYGFIQEHLLLSMIED